MNEHRQRIKEMAEAVAGAERDAMRLSAALAKAMGLRQRDIVEAERLGVEFELDGHLVKAVNRFIHRDNIGWVKILTSPTWEAPNPMIEALYGDRS